MDKVSLLSPEERSVVSSTNKTLLCKGNKSWHNLAYTVWQNGPKASGKTVLMVHGLTSNKEAFNVLAEYITAKHGHTCVTVDMVGRGASSWMEDPKEYAYERYVADVATLISFLNTPELYYVGTSMGGLIGFFLTACPGAPIKKMVINDIGSFVPKSALERIGSYVGKNMVWEDGAKLREYMETIYKPFGLTGGVMDFIYDVYTVKEKDHVRFHYDPQIAHNFTLVDEWKDLDLTPFWAKIDKNLPVLIIHGANSDILLSSTIEEMKKGREETTEVYDVENVGHAPMLFTQAEVERVATFLA